MDAVAQHGVFSVVRWRADAVRDEARNIAVVLANDDGSIAAVRRLPASKLPPQIRTRGIVDRVLDGIDAKAQSRSLSATTLREWFAAYQESLCFTEPRAVSLSNPRDAIESLYAVYVAPPVVEHPVVPAQSKPRPLATRARIIERVERSLRKRNVDVERSFQVKGFRFDLACWARRSRRAVAEVLVFDRDERIDEAEHTAGYFVHALETVRNVDPVAIVQRPTEEQNGRAHDSFKRVARLLGHVRRSVPDDAADVLAALVDDT